VYQYDPSNPDNYTANPYDLPVFPWLIVFEITYFASTCLSVYFGIQCVSNSIPPPLLRQFGEAALLFISFAPRPPCIARPPHSRYHIVKTDKKILDHQTGDIKKRLLFEPIPGWWNVFRRALPEMILLMIQIPPGIKTHFSMPAYNGETVTCAALQLTLIPHVGFI
jgi:hypothetical protein